MVNARSYRTLVETHAKMRAALCKVELPQHGKLHLGTFARTSVRLIELDPTAPAETSSRNRIES
jgi:hypothetical protein